MKRIVAALLALLITVPAVFAQGERTYSQAELDQMLAPIALYPDPLLSQVLMAATYPLELVAAARWTRANPGLQGDAAVQAVQDEDWDPSVKSLVAFPQLLQRMDENLQWTRSLGDAFLAQQPQVMDTVQQLRQRAQAAGNLASNGQLAVQRQAESIYIQPANPQVVYVPYYDPYVVYGPWWWPAYRPVAWTPWPGYVRAVRPGISVSFWWGAPVAVSSGFFFGAFDWPRRTVRVVNVNNYYYRPPVVVNRTVILNRDHWHHDPYHRRGADYRDAGVRRQFAAPAMQGQAGTQIQAPVERRYQRPPGRDMQDSKVLSPAPRSDANHGWREARRPDERIQRAAPPAHMPAARPQQTPPLQARPLQQQERWHARDERHETRTERAPARGRERS